MNYLLVGSESFNLNKRVNQIIDKAVGDNQMAVSFYGGNEKVDIESIIEDCNTIPFLDDKKVVVYQNPEVLDKEEILNKLLNYLKNPSDFTDFLITYNGPLSDYSAAFKKLSSYCKLERFEALTSEQFKQYVNTDLIDNKLKLDSQALNVLFARLPNDLNNWKNELAKLQLYPGALTKEVIEDLITKPLEDNALEFSNAITNKNGAKAWSILQDLMVDNKKDVSSLIGLLASQFRTMSQVKLMQQAGMSVKEIMDSIGTKSEYRIKMINQSIGRLTANELFGILDDLAKLDKDIKTGRIDGQTGLELFVIKAVRR